MMSGMQYANLDPKCLVKMALCLPLDFMTGYEKLLGVY